MNELIRMQERFLQDAHPVRLGRLASCLAHIDALSGHYAHGDGVARMLEECELFCEWAAPDAPLETQLLLRDLQRQVVRWQRGWPQLWDDLESRRRIACEARQWSERVFAASGLLKPEESQRPL